MVKKMNHSITEILMVSYSKESRSSSPFAKLFLCLGHVFIYLSLLFLRSAVSLIYYQYQDNA